MFPKQEESRPSAFAARVHNARQSQLTNKSNEPQYAPFAVV